jgi:SAM-dependent methyltransferase
VSDKCDVRLKRLGFQLASSLAYGWLAPLYEAVARLFSNGEWHTWRRQAVVVLAARTALTGVQPRILEVGCGTGALLIEMTVAGSSVIGLDRSAPMLRAAAQRLRREGSPPVILVQGMAQAVPLPAHSVDCIVLTFPTAYVFDLRTWQEFHRLLTPGGWVIWVDGGEIDRPNLIARLLQALLSPDLDAQRLMLAMPAHVRGLGFAASWQTHELPSGRVSILTAQTGAYEQEGPLSTSDGGP